MEIRKITTVNFLKKEEEHLLIVVKGAKSNGVIMLQAPIANYARKIIMIQMIVGTNAKSAKGTYTTKKIVFTFDTISNCESSGARAL